MATINLVQVTWSLVPLWWFFSFLFSFFQILWCGQMGTHPQEECAKFGHRPDKNPFIFWLHAETCCRNLAIFRVFFWNTKSTTMGHSFHKKSFACVKIIFFRSKKMQKKKKKKNFWLLILEPQSEFIYLRTTLWNQIPSSYLKLPYSISSMVQMICKTYFLVHLDGTLYPSLNWKRDNTQLLNRGERERLYNYKGN